MVSKVNLTIPYTPSADAMESQLGDETVILHLGSGTYFGLDAVGTAIWAQLQAGKAPSSICEHIRAEYPDAPDTMEVEVTAFMTKLLDHDLIHAA